MTTRKSKKTQPPATAEVTIDVGEIARAAEKSFTEADEDRVRTLTDLAGLRTARSLILRRRREDVAALAGEDTDDVRALDGAIEEVGTLVKSFKTQAELAAKPTLAVKPNETVVHGMIRGRDNGVSGIKLSLADDSGPIKGATTTTDKSGHFELRHTLGEKALRKLALHVHDERHAEPVEIEPEAGAAHFIVIRLED